MFRILFTVIYLWDVATDGHNRWLAIDCFVKYTIVVDPQYHLHSTKYLSVVT